MFLARLAEELRAGVAEEVNAASGGEAPWLRQPIPVERPASPARGDFASPVALRVPRTLGLDTAELAERVAVRLRALPWVGRCEATGPGFVTISLNADGLAAIVRGVVSAGSSYGGSRDQDALRANDAPLSHELATDLGQLHARLVAHLRAGSALGVRLDPDRLDPRHLEAPEVRRLVCALAEYPAAVGRTSAPGTGTSRRWEGYLRDLVRLLRRFDGAGGIVPVGPQLPGPGHATRLVVVDASRVVVAAALVRSGLTPPDRA